MRKNELTKELKEELLRKDIEDFEKAIGFSVDDWRKIKDDLSVRESNIAAVLHQKAPDFSAIRLTDTGEITNSKISLSDFNGRHLALVFGSYTCPVFRRHNERINQIYELYKDRISFLHIYVYEMHSVNNWFIPINLKENVIYDQPKNDIERSAIVMDWIKYKNIKMPVAMDDIENTIDTLYAGSPERLYFIDKNGLIQFRSSEGPFDDKEVDEWEKVINNYID